jgi:hypothetical protein
MSEEILSAAADRDRARDIAAIRARWAGVRWRYGAETALVAPVVRYVTTDHGFAYRAIEFGDKVLQTIEARLDDATDDENALLLTDDPTEREIAALQLAAHAPADIQALLDAIDATADLAYWQERAGQAEARLAAIARENVALQDVYTNVYSELLAARAAVRDMLDTFRREMHYIPHEQEQRWRAIGDAP